MTKKSAPGRAKSAATTTESNKIAKTQIAEQIADKTGLTKKQSAEAMDALIEVTVDALKAGKSVGLPGLGTLSIRETAARTGVKPGTSEKIQIPAGKKVAFKVAADLKKDI